MKGIVRPCRRHLGPDLHARWQAHLCGLCLTLRDVAGQPERALTGFDILLRRVLVEAQAGQVETTTAAAAGALLGASAGLVDKLDDGDLPRPVRSPARRVADRLASSGAALAIEVGLDPEPVLRAPRAAAEVQQRCWGNQCANN